MSASKDCPPYEPRDVVAGKYVLRRVLGEGGMAVVYAATDTSCDRQVAIKILRPSVASQRHYSSAHVQREAATVVKLHERTPHVVEVLTAGVTEDAHRLPYYVMERLYGTSLRAGIEQKRALGQPFEIIEVASTVTEIATPLAYAHEMGIVHRDIKPENVYLAEQRDSAYVVKLLDFGISALVADEGYNRVSRRTFSGSRQYAAPEQLDGQPSTAAVDVYALGLILFEMLTFTLPHDRLDRGLTVQQTALNVLRHPIPALGDWRSDVPMRLDTLVRACLANDPDDRPGALQVASILREVKRGIEQKLLGGEEVYATDVTGPPAAVVAQRFDNATEDFTEASAKLGSVGPVDLFASTVDPPARAAPAAVPRDHEVFFMNSVASTEDAPPAAKHPLAQTQPLAGAPAKPFMGTQPLGDGPITPQRIVVLKSDEEGEGRE